MYKVKAETVFEIEVKKSLFIGYLAYVGSEQEAKDYLQKIKKLHPDATHHCYAYCIDEIKRSNDDGEPGNSAGIPILKELMAASLNNAIVVVVRYFRGIKLGVGGLIRAYSSCAKSTILSANLYEIIKIQKLKISFEYHFIDKIEYCLRNYQIIDKQYHQEVTYLFLSNDDLEKTLLELTSGNIKYQRLELIETELPTTLN